MLITEVRAIPRPLPYKETGWKIATGALREARMVFVEILTDAGITGQGCTTAGAPFISGESMVSIVKIIEDVFSELIIGRSPYDIEDIMGALDRVAFMNSRAKAGIDLALHDLMGKALKVPVHSLIGSSQKQRIPVMRLIGLKEPKAMASDAAQLVSQGYRALKIKVGEDKNVDLERVRAIRKAVADDVTLAIDLNGAYKPKDAIELIKALTQYDVALVEQPVQRDDIEGLAFVRERVSIPIEVDESVITLADAARIVRMAAADFISVKLIKMGGIHSARKIAAVCEAFGLGCVIGSTPGSQMVDVANGHFFASTSNVWWAAEVGEYCRMEDDPVSGAMLRDGFLEMPEGPGFGVEVHY